MERPFPRVWSDTGGIRDKFFAAGVAGLASVRPGKEVWGCPRLAVSPLSWQPLSAGALLWVALAFALLFQPPPARARLFI